MPDGSTQTRLGTGVFNGSERPSGFFCRLLNAATSDAQGTRLHDQVLNPPICYPLQCVYCEPVGPIAQWLEQATHNRLVGGSNPSGPTIYTTLQPTHFPMFHAVIAILANVTK